MRRLPRPLAIPLAGLVCGAIGAAVFSALGGVVAGEKSCDIIFSVDSTASLLGTAMFIGVFGGVVGLAVGGLIAGVGVVLSARQNLMVVETGVIAVVVAGGGGPFQLLGSVSLNSGFDHHQCISAALLGGFIGAALGMLVGIQELFLPPLAYFLRHGRGDGGARRVVAVEVCRVDAIAYTHPDAQDYVPEKATLFLRPISEAVDVSVQEWPLDGSWLEPPPGREQSWATVIDEDELKRVPTVSGALGELIRLISFPGSPAWTMRTMLPGTASENSSSNCCRGAGYCGRIGIHSMESISDACDAPRNIIRVGAHHCCHFASYLLNTYGSNQSLRHSEVR